MENKIQLLGHYGSDRTHAQSAWTSTDRELDVIDPKTGEPKKKRIPALLAQLAKDGHHTPFEKSTLHFLVTVEQASHIHILKHRIGVSVNGESARYKELKEDRYYIPQDWPSVHQFALQKHCEECFERYHFILEDLVKEGFSRKRAKESARFFLPYASQITLDVSFNWRSFHHFQGLRNKANAQDEIHDIAIQMLKLVGEIQGNPFKHTIKAFGYDDMKWYVDPFTKA